VISSRGVFFEFDTNVAEVGGNAVSLVSFSEGSGSRRTVFINAIGWFSSIAQGAFTPLTGTHDGGKIRVEITYDGRGKLIIGGEGVYEWERDLLIRATTISQSQHTESFLVGFAGGVSGIRNDEVIAEVENIRTGALELNEIPVAIPLTWQPSNGSVSTSQSEITYAEPSGEFSGRVARASINTLPGAWYVVEAFLSGTDFAIEETDLRLCCGDVAQSFAIFHEEIFQNGLARPERLPVNHRSYVAIKVAFQAARTSHTLEIDFDSKDENATSFMLQTQANRVRCKLAYIVRIGDEETIVTIGEGGIGYASIGDGQSSPFAVRLDVDDEGIVNVIEVYEGTQNTLVIDLLLVPDRDGRQGSLVGQPPRTIAAGLFQESELHLFPTELSIETIRFNMLGVQSTLTLNGGEGLAFIRPPAFQSPFANIFTLFVRSLGNGEYEFLVNGISTNHAGSQGSYTFDVGLNSGSLQIAPFQPCTPTPTAEWSFAGNETVEEGSAASYTLALTGDMPSGFDATINLSITDIDTTPADYGSLTNAVNAAIAAYTGTQR